MSILHRIAPVLFSVVVGIGGGLLVFSRGLPSKPAHVAAEEEQEQLTLPLIGNRTSQAPTATSPYYVNTNPASIPLPSSQSPASPTASPSPSTSPDPTTQPSAEPEGSTTQRLNVAASVEGTGLRGFTANGSLWNQDETQAKGSLTVSSNGTAFYCSPAAPIQSTLEDGLTKVQVSLSCISSPGKESRMGKAVFSKSAETIGSLHFVLYYPKSTNAYLSLQGEFSSGTLEFLNQ